MALSAYLRRLEPLLWLLQSSRLESLIRIPTNSNTESCMVLFSGNFTVLSPHRKQTPLLAELVDVRFHGYKMSIYLSAYTL